MNKNTIITSTQNERVRYLCKLREKKYREKTGDILIDGKKPLLAAIQSNVTIRCLYFTGTLRDKDADFFDKIKSYPSQEISPSVYEKIAYGDWKDQIVALAAKPSSVSLDQLKNKPDDLFVLLDKVEKPGNIGAVLRTCDALGCGGVIVCHSPMDLYNPNIIRSSLGTCFSVPYLQATTEEITSFVRERKIHCVALSPDGKKKYSRLPYRRPLLLIAGNEHEGLSPFWLEDESLDTVFIPMKGIADSLNVSVALTMVLCEASR
ncbi:MAG: RNA methyltransferase [Candidatus Aureabacteria bacterium]|nr:RNA methyltransferase [Candidatus Auribacterota bacterium]